MSLAPQGISGSSFGGGTLDWSTYSTVNAPGAIYELSRWRGNTLRKLVLSVMATATSVYSRLQIATDYPRGSLRPENAVPNPLFEVFVNAGIMFNSGGSVQFDFPPGLITVLPGESLYVIMYNWVSVSTSTSLIWSLNMLWEPWGGDYEP